MDLEEKKKMAYRIGDTVLVLLVALTAGEFFIGRYAPYWWAPLLAIAFLKAFFVVRDFMHVSAVFAGEEEEGH
jgi:Prokaryotic Cytochrome C oxidase subunit IV